jgi:hypothetical protein
MRGLIALVFTLTITLNTDLGWLLVPLLGLQLLAGIDRQLFKK